MSDRPEYAHPSFEVADRSVEAIERVWRTFWLPLVTERIDGQPKLILEKLKGELFDAHHLIMTAPRVYHLVTGGMTDDACASFDGIKAAYEKHLRDAVEAAVNAELRRRGLSQ